MFKYGNVDYFNVIKMTDTQNLKGKLVTHESSLDDIIALFCGRFKMLCNSVYEYRRILRDPKSFLELFIGNVELPIQDFSYSSDPEIEPFYDLRFCSEKRTGSRTVVSTYNTMSEEGKKYRDLTKDKHWKEHRLIIGKHKSNPEINLYLEYLRHKRAAITNILRIGVMRQPLNLKEHLDRDEISGEGFRLSRIRCNKPHIDGSDRYINALQGHVDPTLTQEEKDVLYHIAGQWIAKDSGVIC